MTRNSARQTPELVGNLVLIGKIVKPHGIRGEVKVYTYSEQSGNFQHYKNIVLREAAGDGTTKYKIVRSREQGKLAILQLAGIDSREMAEALQGSTVWLNKADLPVLDPDQYYWHQLENLMVLTESGMELGKVSRLFKTPAHDIMVVTGGGHEYMIPVKGDIIKKIDGQEGKIIISPPVGLLEINK